MSISVLYFINHRYITANDASDIRHMSRPMYVRVASHDAPFECSHIGRKSSSPSLLPNIGRPVPHFPIYYSAQASARR